MIVLAPLIIFTILLVVMVVGGKLIYPPPPRYVLPTRPVAAVALSSGVVHSAGRAVQGIEPGDTVWVVRAGNGAPVLFADSTGSRVLGVGEVFLAPLTGR